MPPMRNQAFVLALLVACGGGKQAAPPPQPTAPTAGSASTMTAEECTSAGGEVVGDIGDGAIHRPEYRCAKSSTA